MLSGTVVPLLQAFAMDRARKRRHVHTDTRAGM